MGQVISIGNAFTEEHDAPDMKERYQRLIKGEAELNRKIDQLAELKESLAQVDDFLKKVNQEWGFSDA